MSKEAKPTPGPWKHEIRKGMRGNIHSISIYSPCGLPEETGWAHFDVQLYSKPSEAEANARLIAAAPDLLEALEELLKYQSIKNLRQFDNFPVFKKIDAAIAKARGQS